MQTDYQVDYIHDQEPMQNGGATETQKNKKFIRWIKIGFQILLQIGIVGYFSYATYHYHDLSTYIHQNIYK